MLSEGICSADVRGEEAANSRPQALRRGETNSSVPLISGTIPGLLRAVSTRVCAVVFCLLSFVCCLLFSVSFCLNSQYSASPHLPPLPSCALHGTCDPCLACTFSLPSISLVCVTLPCLLNSFAVRGRPALSVVSISCNGKRILIGLTTAETDVSVH